MAGPRRSHRNKNTGNRNRKSSRPNAKGGRSDNRSSSAKGKWSSNNRQRSRSSRNDRSSSAFRQNTKKARAVEKKSLWQIFLSWFGFKPSKKTSTKSVMDFASDATSLFSKRIEVLPALFSRFPELVDRLLWLNIRNSEEVSQPVFLRRSQHFYGDNLTLMKRESLDVDRFSETQARQLEFLLAPLVKQDMKNWVCFAYYGSAYALAVVQLARSLGCRVRVHFLRCETTDVRTRRVVEMRRLGAKLEFHSSENSLEWAKKKEGFLGRFRRSAILPFEGLSALSSMGYISALFELNAQMESGETPKPDYLFVSLTNGSAIVGLEIAKRMLGWNDLKICALAYPGASICGKEDLVEISKDLVEALNEVLSEPLNIKLKETDFWVESPELETQSETLEQFLSRWSHQFFDLETIELDSEEVSYALFGMSKLIEKKAISSKTILFWNTFSTVKADFLNFNLRSERLPAIVRAWRKESKVA